MLLHRGGDARGAQLVDEGEEHGSGCSAQSLHRPQPWRARQPEVRYLDRSGVKCEATHTSFGEDGMLTLYSFGPGANSLKPLLTLYEKGLEFKIVRLNPAKFEHHEDWFKAINPNGQVPALVDDDKVITKSTVICEYLEDEYPTEVKLRPDDSYGRAQMRVWTKWVDEYFCWCVSTIGWERMIKPNGARDRRRGVRGEGEADPDPRAADQVAQRPRRLPAGRCWTRRCARSASRSAGSRRGWRRASGWPATCTRWPTSAISRSPTACSSASPSWSTQSDTPNLIRWIEQINARPAAKRMYAEVPFERLEPEEAA